MAQAVLMAKAFTRFMRMMLPEMGSLLIQLAKGMSPSLNRLHNQVCPYQVRLLWSMLARTVLMGHPVNQYTQLLCSNEIQVNPVRLLVAPWTSGLIY
jgi:hypothetical protein